MSGTWFIRQRSKMLRTFDRGAAVAADIMRRDDDPAVVEAILSDARDRFDRVIAELEDPGLAAHHLRWCTAIAAMWLAFYQAMKERGRSVEQAWDICDETLESMLNDIPAWARAVLARVYFGRFFRSYARWLADRSQAHDLGGWQMEFVEGEGDFDYGLDYVRCAIHELLTRHGADEFAPYVCLGDIAASEALGWGLQRSETINQGCARCNFRFRRGAATEVLSPVLNRTRRAALRTARD